MNRSDNNTLGLKCLEQGLYHEAIGWFEKELQELEQNHGDIDSIILFNLGVAYASTGQYSSAIDYLLRSLLYAPRYALTKSYIADCVGLSIADALPPSAPDIARLLVEFREHMGWPDVLDNPSSTKEFLHFMQAARLCGADSIALDVSAGFCRNKPFFAHAQYVAIDLELAKSWDFSGLDLIGDALNLPIKDDSIDLIISSSSLEHYSNPFKAFQGFARVLKPGGHLYLDVPFTHVEHQIPHDYFRFSRYALNHLCKENGLKVKSIVPDSSSLGSGFRMFREAIATIEAAFEPKGTDTHKILLETATYLDQVFHPIIDDIDRQCMKDGIGDDIDNCSQYPVRYNLIASKPGKLRKPRHYTQRTELLKAIAECPACHASGLDWQAGQCICPACGKAYSLNASGIPRLLVS